MSLGSLQLGLHLGAALEPAPASIARALRGVEVTRSDQAPNNFQLTFHTEPGQPGVDDYAVVSESRLEAGSRVGLVVTLDGDSTVLMDGFVTGQQLVPYAFGSGAGNGSSFVVSGEDVAVKMDALELPIEYPLLPDAGIVGVVLAKYLVFGVVPEIAPNLGGLAPAEFVPQQNATDLSYVQELAQKNGAVFYVAPGPSLGLNVAYWGPPRYDSPTQPALNVNQGPFTNVQSMQFSYDSRTPYFMYGVVMETEVDPYLPIPVVTLGSTRFPPLATDPALSIPGAAELAVRTNLWQDQGMSPARSLITAQAMTNLSTDKVVTVQGELDVVRYGRLLEAPGVVGVRGVGERYDGLYYVCCTTHRIQARTGDWSYKQSFTLNREGLGTTVDTLPV